jgi:membrane peptidoglycan carboxypeptidase
MSMAAAYATVASGGRYCSPTAIAKIVVTATGQQLPVKSAGCHQAIPSGVAAAANYILQQVLFGAGTANGRAVPGHTEAAKTGTADLGFYAAFAGWTPTLAGYVSVFNPFNPTGAGRMMGQNSCYVDTSGPVCPGQMFGAMAPGATWQETFTNAALGPDVGFPQAPSSYYSQGPGFGAPVSCNQPSTGGPSPAPSPSLNPDGSCPSPKKKPPVPNPTASP